MQARYYSPILKRFLNEDPAGFAGGRNLYAYCSGDPVNAMDPFGLGKVSAASNFGSSSTFSGVAGAALNGADRFTTQFNSLLWNTVNGQGLADLVGTATGYLYSLADPATRSGAWSNTVDDFSRLGSAQEWKNTGSYMISPEGLASAAFMIDATLAGGLGRGNCFPAGTKVSTSHGDVNIEDIEVGDLVYAYDFATGTVVESRVSETPRHFTYYWVEIQVAGETIKSTRKHPFWVQSENRWVDAVDLKAGMDVRLLTGQTAAIVSTFVHELQNPETTYNFEVEVQHNYFVGHAHVLVHNPPDGSYTNTHLSGKEYVGKGDATRAAESAVEKALKFNDPLVKTNWTPANGTADSFVQEEMRLRVAGGPRGNTYNKINSPGNMIASGSGCP